MLLLAPSLLLIAGLLVLVGLRRWRPAFKSYWLVAVAAAVLATLLVLALRLGLPRAAAFAGWRIGDGLEFTFTLALSAFSWPLALAASALLLASLLAGVRKAPQAGWATWLPALALGAAGLLVVLSGDLLAFSFTLFLFDVLALILQSATAEPRWLVRRFGLGLLSIFLILLVWATPASYAAFGHAMLLLAAALRLADAAAAWASRETEAELHAALRTAALAGGLALLAFVQPLSGALLHFILAVLLAISLWAARRWFISPGEAARPSLITVFATLGLAAACAGVPQAAVALGLVALCATSLLGVLSVFPLARLPLLAAAALLLVGLPFTAAQGASGLYAAPASPLAYAFLLPHSFALAGLLRAVGGVQLALLPEERWTRGVETLGVVLPAIFFMLLGLGLAPAFESAAAPIWPTLAVLVLTGGLLAAARSRVRLLPPHVKLPRIQFDAARIGRAVWSGLQAALALVSSLLEGESGLLWALLLIALLISIVAQSGFAG
jgi:hypothetical protein